MRKEWLKLVQWFLEDFQMEYMKNLNKLESDSPSNSMCQIWLNLA